jgi:hypothetical protein
MLIGQPALHLKKTLFQRDGEEQIVARFMTEELPFHGVRSAQDCATCLQGYDLGEYLDHSGWNHTRFFSPRAYDVWLRLVAEGTSLWESFGSLTNAHGSPVNWKFLWNILPAPCTMSCFSMLRMIAQTLPSPPRSGMTPSTSQAMYATENSSPRTDPANLPWMREQPHRVQLPTYTARPAWTYPLKSAWSRLSKFQTLNRLSWQQLTEALSVLRTINAECGIDLRASDAFDILTLARTLRVPHADLQSAFCVQSNQEVMLDAGSQSLRFCQSCAETGFHATLFQFAAITYCPIHHRALRDTCFNCARSIPYRLDVALMQHPYACPTCATSLLAGPLHHQRCAALAPRTFDRLRPWHEYFAWCAGLVNLDSRRQRDISSGQYLSNDAIQRSSPARHRYCAAIGYISMPCRATYPDHLHLHLIYLAASTREGGQTSMLHASL